MGNYYREDCFLNVMSNNFAVKPTPHNLLCPTSECNLGSRGAPESHNTGAV